MNFLPGKPIEELVERQIKARQDAFKSSEGEGRQNYIALQQAVPWVRLSSAVKIAPDTDLADRYGSGFELAKENILYNFLDKGLEDLPGYDFSKLGLGYRPKPGITDVQIHSHNRFGSLRTAVVRFQCWSKEQIDKLELLYMRPGYTLLLEWGWSGYIDTESKDFNNTIRFLDLYSSRDGALNATSLRNKLDEKIKSYDYNYDGIFGLIKNFSWSARPDGGYDCTTSIVTTGELVESYKANFYLSQASVLEKIKNEVKQFNENQIEQGETQTFDGLELNYYSQLDEDRVGLGKKDRASFINLINEAENQAKLIQAAINDICFTVTSTVASEDTLSEDDYEVVSSKTVVTEYTVRTERTATNPLSNEPVKITPGIALVKVRSSPVEFALKVTAENIGEGSKKVGALIRNSKRTLRLVSQPPTIANSSVGGAPKDLYYAEPELIRAVNSKNSATSIRDFKAYRFYVLSYTPPVESPTSTVQDVEATEAESTAAPTGNTSLLHDLLINDIKSRLGAKHVEDFKSFNKTNTFAEVFKYRETELIQNTLLKRLIDKEPRYKTFLCGKVESGKNKSDSGEAATDILAYIKLGMLLDIFNEGILETDDHEKLFRFETKPLRDGGTPTYFVHEDQISIDPSICLLPPSLSIYGVNPEPILPVTQTGGQPCAILDIELECEYLASILDGFIAQGGRVSIYDYLDQIFQDIKRVTGGVIELDLQFSERTSAYVVVDRRKINRPGKAFPIISTLGKDSTITSLNLVSKLTPKIASMIGISAQDSPFTGTEEAAGFQALNRGLIDGVFPQRKDPLAFKENKDEEFKTFLNEFREDATNTLLYINSFYNSRLTLPGADVACGNYENYCKILLGRKFKEQGTAFNFIIPFELTLSMRGLGGLHVMESFKISKDILPSTYGGRVTKVRGKNVTDVAFMITGLEHQINRQGWTTDIKTQIYNVDETTTESPITLEKGIVKISAGNGKGTTPTNTPWSAAFISYVHSKAGYSKATFPFSAAHSTYAQKIRTSFTSNFDVLDPAKNTPIVGDIIVANREKNNLTFATKEWTGATHGDVVVQVSENAAAGKQGTKADITVIGGNIKDTVFKGKKDLILKSFRINQAATELKFVLTEPFVILRPKDKNLATKVVSEAIAEHKFWQVENKFKESDPGAFDRLAKYWKLLGTVLQKD